MNFDVLVPGCAGFRWKDVTWSAVTGKHIIPTPFQEYAYSFLLSSVERWVKVNGRIIITSGIRDAEVVEALRAKGYPVSKTSDHFCWCNWETKEVRSGAIDFIIEGMHQNLAQCWTFYEEIYKSVSHGFLPCGQWIIYPAITSTYFHLSNPKRIAFWTAQETPKKYLVHVNKKYLPYKPGERSLDYYITEAKKIAI